MALPLSNHTSPREPDPPLDAEAALAIAEGYLIDRVGDLLGAEDPQLADGRRWVLSITLSNAVQGPLGVVGTIAVDAVSGEVFFSEEERARVKVRARELAGASAP